MKASFPTISIPGESNYGVNGASSTGGFAGEQGHSGEGRNRFDIAYFRTPFRHQSPPSSPPTRPRMPTRPRPPTPTAIQTNQDWLDFDQQDESISPSSAYIVDPSTAAEPSPVSETSFARHPVGRSGSDEDAYVTDSGFAQSPVRSPKLAGLPDPSQYPDPYPFRPPHWLHGTSTPALSSGDSSSASTRSSAYTNSAKSGDYGHVHVALDSQEPDVGVGITTDQVVTLFDHDPASSPTQHSRLPTDQSRWSDYYSKAARSRSSSIGKVKTDSLHDAGDGKAHENSAFDMNWQSVDERDEIGLTSEDETDDDGLVDDDEDNDEHELPTSAMMIAEEGLGVIVHGENTPINQLQVNPGTTHLIIGSSPTPNAVPSFLTGCIPFLTTTLLALDISCNFLQSLPPALETCICLEELNISSNPLRALPVFLSKLISLKVLIADSVGLSTLPPALSVLDKLHSLSIRRNKMHSLPSWLCKLPVLETLLVDDNPFQGPWKALMEPLLARTPMSPLYPPSTPLFPPHSAGISIRSDTDTEDEIQEHETQSFVVPEEDTITPARAPPLMRSVTAPAAHLGGPLSPPPRSPQTLTRTRTTPNKAYYDKTRAASKPNLASYSTAGPSGSGSPTSDSRAAEREVRKMKSAGELRRNYTSLAASLPQSNSATTSPQRPTLSHYANSASSSNLLQVGSPPQDLQMPKRFASVGVVSGAGALSPGGTRSRPAVDHSIWDGPSAAEPPPPVPVKSPVPRLPSGDGSPPPKVRDSRYREVEVRPVKEEKERSSRWGFLKKMSMGKIRSDPPSRSAAQARPPPVPTPHPRHMVNLTQTPESTPELPRFSVTPQIDVRISTTGSILNSPSSVLPSSLSRKPSADMLKSQLPPTIPELNNKSSLQPPRVPQPINTNLLVPPTVTPRASKRRSFLPIDVSAPAPPAGSYMPTLVATNDSDDAGRTTPSPQAPQQEASEQQQRREEEKTREARTRALRSVMAYLRDMFDLSLSQSNTVSMYGDGHLPGARRPTIVERVGSDSLSASMYGGIRPDSSFHNMRSSEVRTRSGTTTQTNSVATTDSTGSAEERKYKNDRGKRSRILREIVETERTYVKGLQELVDIYIKPAAVQVSGIGQGRDTVLPASERKVVFNGLESLFSFHRESFLPALEKAVAPIMRPSDELVLIDADGETSLSSARALAQVFVSHAAFMKMYSTYINNFDNSVQRIKAWSSDKAANTLSPQSSTAQLVSLALTISAATAQGALGDAQNMTTLTSSQKKRIKTYLKRCRLNPRHSQLNLEGYLLLPVQRIPRYKLLLEELLRSCPPLYEYMEDPLDRALAEISVLATNMNEGKRDAETRKKLVMWQSRIRGKFPSPLVQPHRRLIMDGSLHLTRVVRKATVAFEVIDAQGDTSQVQVECLSPEPTPRSLIGVLCNDLLVLCRDPSEGQDPHSQVDLWAVLRMQTLPQPASIVHGNSLRLVDNKAILYFDTPSTSDALTWFRAINLNMASKA